MAGRLGEYRLFFKQFVRHFHTTGALLPSGPWLARRLVRYLEPCHGGRRILEVGPGTGAVTRHIVGRLGPCDTLDLVELNDAFVARLRQRFANDPQFRPAASRVQIFHCPIEDLPTDRQYDLIISGLPLNNFPAELVRHILARLTALLAPGGTLSFFEYIAVRKARGLISGRSERARLRGITAALHKTLAHEVRRDWVWPNVPPAWVHHVRRPAAAPWDCQAEEPAAAR